MMVNERDDKLIDFDSKYPYILPEDWKEKNSPSVYEILATTNTLKRMYADKVKEIEEGDTSNKLGAVSYTHLTLPTTPYV